MKVLIACEYSGIVRDAFELVGHDAWSCDILPCEGNPAKHRQEDVLGGILNEGWDLIIAHPPCTYLSNAGNRHFNEERYGDKARARKKKREEAMRFFLALINAPCARVCVENPVGWPNSHFRKPDQTIHPYFFGSQHLKRTSLWLRGLPPLTYDKSIPMPAPVGITIRKPSKYYKGGEVKRQYITQNKERNPHKRDKTFPEIAAAMAEQWGAL